MIPGNEHALNKVGEKIHDLHVVGSDDEQRRIFLRNEPRGAYGAGIGHRKRIFPRIYKVDRMVGRRNVEWVIPFVGHGKEHGGAADDRIGVWQIIRKSSLDLNHIRSWVAKPILIHLHAQDAVAEVKNLADSSDVGLFKIGKITWEGV